jgi:hypothetical protein
MKLLTLTLLCIAAMVSVSGCGNSPAVVPVDLTNAEYQVISSYLREKFKSDAEHNKRSLVIISETKDTKDDPVGTDEMYKLMPTLKSTHREVFQSFLETNHHSSSFQTVFDIPIPYQIIKSSEMQSMGAGGHFWERFYEKYPNSTGLLRLSRVGFNSGGNQAAFYVSNHCGGLCGGGYFVIMQKDSNSEWKIDQEFQLWIS